MYKVTCKTKQQVASYKPKGFIHGKIMITCKTGIHVKYVISANNIMSNVFDTYTIRPIKIIFRAPQTRPVESVNGILIMSLVVRKPVFGVSDQIRHKPACTATKDG